jgi:hypothetical protein
MSRTTLESEGFAHYVETLRSGSRDPYIAYRVFEKNWQVPPEHASLVRAATLELIEKDPWFLATAMPHFLSGLRRTDLERLTKFVGAGPARHAAAMLRAILWYHGESGPFGRDRGTPARLRRVLEFLDEVPKKQRDLSWHEMRVGCYRAVDYELYKKAFPAMLELTDPEWRLRPLEGFLNEVAKRDDWKTYDEVRPQVDQLSPGQHSCECHTNSLFTNDGLRAVAAGNWEAIPGALSKAAAVRGCPHLNTGGLRLALVRMLVTKKKQLSAARAYVERAATFPAAEKDLASLRQRLVEL